MSDDSLGKKNLLENSWLNSLSIPILIVFLGAAIIFGVTKILSTDRGYKDLVRELNSKSFGNKWVSAYELSKVINSSSIKKEDIPWIVDNLKDVYMGSTDPRTKQFIIVALGALKSPRSMVVYNDVLKYREINADVLIQTLISISKLEKLEENIVTNLEKYFNRSEPLVKQTLYFITSKFKISKFINHLELALEEKNVFIRYSAATSLIIFKNKKSLNILKEVLVMRRDKKRLNIDEKQRKLLIYNVLIGLRNANWNVLEKELKDLSEVELDLELKNEARKNLK